MDKNWERLQWVLSVGVFHGASFGHRIDAWTDLGARGAVNLGSWEWKGIGIPEPKLQALRTKVDACLSDHFVTRYGVAGEFPHRWTGEPEPF